MRFCDHEQHELTRTNAICERREGTLGDLAIFRNDRLIHAQSSEFLELEIIVENWQKKRRNDIKIFRDVDRGEKFSLIDTLRCENTATWNCDVIGRDCHGGCKRPCDERGTRKTMDEKAPKRRHLARGATANFMALRAIRDLFDKFRYLRDRRAGCRAVSRWAADPPASRRCSRGCRRRQPYDASPGTNIPAAPSSTPFSTAMQRIVRCTSALAQPRFRGRPDRLSFPLPTRASSSALSAVAALLRCARCAYCAHCAHCALPASRFPPLCALRLLQCLRLALVALLCAHIRNIWEYPETSFRAVSLSRTFLSTYDIWCHYVWRDDERATNKMFIARAWLWHFIFQIPIKNILWNFYFYEQDFIDIHYKYIE